MLRARSDVRAATVYDKHNRQVAQYLGPKRTPSDAAHDLSRQVPNIGAQLGRDSDGPVEYRVVR